jgi:hypothetical protein
MKENAYKLLQVTFYILEVGNDADYVLTLIDKIIYNFKCVTDSTDYEANFYFVISLRVFENSAEESIWIKG